MKKRILCVLICLVLIFNCGIAMAAQTSTVNEDKTAKVFVDGTAMKTVSVPVINSKKLMLSTELFTALGAKSQVWDKTKTKLTVTKGTIKLVLQLNSTTATLNGAKKTLSVKPIMYKSKAYFPVDFVAACFAKQFSIDTETNTYFLKDKTEFEKNKKLLDNVLKAMNSISKLKGTDNVTLNLNGNGVKLNMVMPTTTLMDRTSKIAVGDINIKQTTNGVLAESKIRAVLANNEQYMQVNGGEWQKSELTPEQFAEQFNFNNNFKYNDVICSGLNTVNGTKKDEVILKGNVMMGDSISSFLEGQELVDNSISAKSIEITLNKDTNIVSKIVLKVSGTTIIKNLKFNFSVDYLINFSDINGSFEVAVPDELK